jgi:hypothetical protein
MTDHRVPYTAGITAMMRFFFPVTGLIIPRVIYRSGKVKKQ